MNKKLFGFTLAEVLITLAIIGVVAALTIPTLISNHKTKVVITTLKKTHAIVSESARRAVAEHGDITGWNMVHDDIESAKILGKILVPYFNIVNNYGTGYCEEYDIDMKFLRGTNVDFNPNKFYKIKLLDGSFLLLRPNNDSYSIFIDVNGNKLPNTIGIDIFRFIVDSRGNVVFMDTNLDPSSKKDSYWMGCNPEFGQGWRCIEWVLNKENMDYLKCANKLKWDGPTTCR